MELFLFSGTLISIAGHHIIWTAEPSAEQLEKEKYWETQVKIWEIQRKRELNNQIQNSL
jgi:hypothetical protein